MIANSLEHASVTEVISPGPYPAELLFGLAPPMHTLESVIARVAPTDMPVLLFGESGTGKRAIAFHIHYRSGRSCQPFLRFSSVGLSTESLRADLLQGDNANDRGRAANCGTIFLDEVSQLEPASQDRLAHLLLTAERLPEGSLPAVRLISSTTRNLKQEVQNGRFNEALYYLINGVCMRVPALRQRTEDIPALMDFLLKRYSQLFALPERKLLPTSMDLLLRYPWPGNLRELESVARNIVALGDEELALSELSFDATPIIPLSQAERAGRGGQSDGRSLRDAAREASRSTERQLIAKTLERTHWNRKRTARELQVSYKALLYKLKQLGLERSDSER